MGEGFMQGDNYKNVVIDMHMYQCFDEGLRQAPYSTHITSSCTVDQNRVKIQKWPVIVGK